MADCIFCNPRLESNQTIIIENEYSMFLQLDETKEKGRTLAGSGVIVPKKHRATAFDLTIEEWQATYELLHDVKDYIDEVFQPQGYNLGWNCGEVGGQHIFHAHLHVLPRYEDEVLAGKGMRHAIKSSDNRRRGTL